jgi:hypothetical protein
VRGLYEAQQAYGESLAEWRGRLWGLLREWGHVDRKAFDQGISRLDANEESALALAWAVALFVSNMMDDAEQGRHQSIEAPAAYWATMVSRRARAVSALDAVERRAGRRWPRIDPR